MERQRESERRRVDRPTRHYAIAAAGCSLLAGIASWSGLILIVAGHTIPGWLIGAALLCVALVLLVVRAIARRPPPDGANRPEWPRAPHRWVLATPGAVAALGTLFGAAGDLGADYRILDPPGPGGCRAVVRETSFLVTGSGKVYSVGSGGIGWRASSWTADDGYRPIVAGTYALRWGTGGGTLTVDGTATDPVWPALHEITCA